MSEYDIEYLKAMMSRLDSNAVQYILDLVETFLSNDEILESKYEAKQIVRMREDIDARLKEYRENN